MFAFSYSYNNKLDKDRRRSVMSVGSIGSDEAGVGSLLGPKSVNGASASPSSGPREQSEVSARSEPRGDTKSPEQYRESEKNIYDSSSSTSTQDFLFLRGLGEEEGQYDILDDTIKEMKENMEAIGEAIEAMAELVEKTSDSSIAMQLLTKTVEEMDKADGDSGGKTGSLIDIKA